MIREGLGEFHATDYLETQLSQVIYSGRRFGLGFTRGEKSIKIFTETSETALWVVLGEEFKNVIEF